MERFRKITVVLVLLLPVLGAKQFQVGERPLYHAPGGSPATYVGWNGANTASIIYSCTVGNVLHFAFWDDNTPTGVVPSSTPSTTWHVIDTAIDGSNLVTMSWWGLCPSTGSTTFTTNWSGGDISLAVAEYTRIGTSTVDQHTNSASTNPIVLSVSGLAGSPELGLAAVNDNIGGSGSTSSSGWTKRSTGIYINMFDNLTAGPGTASVSVALSTGSSTGTMGVLK